MSFRVLAQPRCPTACASWWSLNIRSCRVSLLPIHMRPLYISNPLFFSHSPSVIFPSRVVPFAFFLRISWISLSAVLSVQILRRSSLSISWLMVSVVLAWSTLAWLLIQGVSKASSGNRIQPLFCQCFISPFQRESPDSLDRMSSLPANFPGQYLIMKS